MKQLFYLGAICLILFEIANVYFIMPMPGSQEMNSIGLAYFLYTFRWVIRIFFALLIFLGVLSVYKNAKILPSLTLVALFYIIYETNFVMAADAMFVQTDKLKMVSAKENGIDSARIILGVAFNGEAKAYPIQFLGFHHQVFDSIANKPVIVTYCTVCRTGRVYEPIVNGKVEKFRLVGMDHFNALFEDATTKSWWRQATGEAIAGKLKGTFLPEFTSKQMSLKNWLDLYPNSTIMQENLRFKPEYDSLSNYEAGRRNGKLTRRDSLSWQNKSWVIGVNNGNESKAFDWKILEKEHIIHDVLDSKPIVVVLLNDNKTFVAFERANENQKFYLENDHLKDGVNSYNLLGVSTNAAVPNLKNINAYQEYWQSWRTFHPDTKS